MPGAVMMTVLPLLGVRAGRQLAHMMAIALVANIGLNLIVIPRFGPIGAAATTLACQLALLVAIVPPFARVRLLDADPGATTSQST